MPQGLQCWDANGNLILDVTDRLTRVLGEVYTGTSGSGTIIDNNFLNGTPWYISTPSVRTYDPQSLQVVITGNTLTWSFTQTNSWQKSHRIMYGVY